MKQMCMLIQVFFKTKTDINWYDFNYKDLAKGNTNV